MQFHSTALTVAFGFLLVLSGQAKTVVHYWEKWGGFEAEAMQEIVADFNRSQTEIEVRFLSVNPIDVKLLLAASSGNPPDLAGLWSFSVPDFAEKGALTPLDGAILKAGLGREHYIPVFWDLCRHRDFTWALPTTPGCVGLYYNKRLFREAGLDPDRPPGTFAELQDYSRRLTQVEVERKGERVRLSWIELSAEEKAARRYHVVQVGHLPQDAGIFLSAWGVWFDANFYDGNRSIQAMDTGNLRALEWQRAVVEEIGLRPMQDYSASFGQAQTSHSPFLAQRSAMVLQGPWLKNFMEKFSPDLEWGFAPFPAFGHAAGAAPVTLVETDVIVVPRGAKNPKEAFAFIAYLQRQEVAEKLATLQRKFTALREHSEAFVRTHPHPAIAQFIALAQSSGARAVPRLSIWREYDAEMSIAAERVRSLAISPDAALQQVQKRVQWRMDRVMRRWDIIRDERLKEWRAYDRW